MSGVMSLARSGQELATTLMKKTHRIMCKDGKDEEVLENLLKAFQVRSEAFCVEMLTTKEAENLLRSDELIH